MWRQLCVTLAIMIAVLVLASPIIFAEPAGTPSNYNYPAAVFHIVAPTNTPAARDIEASFDQGEAMLVQPPSTS
jgi:hypothetical protein